MKTIAKRFFLFCSSVFLFSQVSFADMVTGPYVDSAEAYTNYPTIYLGQLNHSNAEFFFLNNHFHSFQFSLTVNNNFIPDYFPMTQFGFSRFASNYSMPSQPFFCSMEYKVQNKLNFWIKLRAGTDADYMKSIKVYHQFDYH